MVVGGGGGVFACSGHNGFWNFGQLGSVGVGGCLHAVDTMALGTKLMICRCNYQLSPG